MLSARKTLKEIASFKKIALARMNEIRTARLKKEEHLDYHGIPRAGEFRTYNKADAAAWLGIEHMTQFNRFFDSIKDKNPSKIFSREKNKNYRFSIEDLYFFADELGLEPFERSKLSECIVAVITNLKGGVAKTTTTVNLGAGLSVSSSKRYRVAVIDLDPQGTATMFGMPRFSDEDYSVGDLMQNNYKLDEGDDENEFIKSCFLDTSIPNLKYLPGRVTDFFFESYAETLKLESSVEDQLSVYRILKEKIIDAVKDDFDIILIDTPPALNKAFYNAIYAANAVVIPVEPELVAFDSTLKYLTRFEEIYSIAAKAGHQGYEFMRLIVTNFDSLNSTKQSTQTISKSYFNSLRKMFGSRVFSNPTKRSNAYPICADFFSSIYGLRPSEYPKSAKQLNDAVSNMNEIVSEFEMLCHQAWSGSEFDGEE